MAAATALAPAAAHSRSAALTALLLRLAAALALLTALALLARVSVLAKVVAAILTGVLLMAVGAVGVVGTVLTSSYQRQQAGQASEVAQGRVDAISELETSALQFAKVVALCPSSPDGCARLLTLVSSQPNSFAVVVDPAGQLQQFGEQLPLDRAALLQLVAQPAVRQVLAGGATAPSELGTLAGFTGREPTLAVLGIAAGPRSAGPTSAPRFAAVYGIVLGDENAQASSALTGGYDVTLLIRDRVVASSLAPQQAADVRRVAGAQRLASRPLEPDRGLTVSSEGIAPTVHFRPLFSGPDRVGVLAVSQPAAAVLGTQRDALRDLFLTALVVTVLVAAASLALGRRVVEPVRRLTVAASRVRGGDLSVQPPPAGSDEVGTLSRAFGEMTASLSKITEDLRSSADQEAALRARLEAVLGSMSDALVATGSDGTSTSLNPAAVALTGLRSADDGLGRPLHDVLDVRRPDGETLLVLDSERHETAGELIRPDGRAVPVGVAIAPLEGEQGIGRGHVVVLRDTTRERQVERMKTEFCPTSAASCGRRSRRSAGTPSCSAAGPTCRPNRRRSTSRASSRAASGCHAWSTSSSTSPRSRPVASYRLPDRSRSTRLSTNGSTAGASGRRSDGRTCAAASPPRCRS